MRYKKISTNGIALLIGILLVMSCGKGVRSGNQSAQRAGNEPRQTPIPLTSTKKNKGKRCEALNYYLSDVKGDEYRMECYKLQKQLSEAAAKNDLPGVKEALKYGAHPDGITDDNYTALHAAAGNGQIEVVRLLLDNGANVNWGDFISGTPLIMAADGGHEDIVTILLAKGANVCIKADGGTALDGARRQGHKKIVDLLVSAGGEKCK